MIFFKTRWFNPVRPDVPMMLDEMGIEGYNIWKIVQITHGKKLSDFIWLKFEKDDALTWEDIERDRP